MTASLGLQPKLDRACLRETIKNHELNSEETRKKKKIHKNESELVKNILAH